MKSIHLTLTEVFKVSRNRRELEIGKSSMICFNYPLIIKKLNCFDEIMFAGFEKLSTTCSQNKDDRSVAMVTTGVLVWDQVMFNGLLLKHTHDFFANIWHFHIFSMTKQIAHL